MPMLLFPNCKINIGLRVVARRADGYHDIETVMVPVRGLCDILEIVRSRSGDVEFSSSGLPVGGPPEKNLCVRAYGAVREACGIGGVKIHLHKIVPMGAGLGGGSADAAYVIKGLSDLFSLGLSVAQMESLAAGIGSDTAFFVGNRPALATGRGEVLSPVELSLRGRRLVIVKPDEFVSTAEAYARVTPRRADAPLAELLERPFDVWREEVRNDFEPSVFEGHPVIGRIRDSLYRQGAVYASMTGSGAAVYGIFDRVPPVLDGFDKMFVYQEDMS